MRKLIMIMAFGACLVAAKDNEPVTEKSGANGKLSELDKQTLLKTNYQLQLIQGQIQQAVAPITAEQESIKKRVCSAAKIDYNKCNVDPNAGTVTQVPDPPKPAPAPAPVSK